MTIIFDPYDIYVPRNTSLALSFSLIAHAALFSVAWKMITSHPQVLMKPQLSVVLVNRKTSQMPQNASVLAQSNLDGRGNPDHIKHQARVLAIDNPTANNGSNAAGEQQPFKVTITHNQEATGHAKTSATQLASDYLTRLQGARATLKPHAQQNTAALSPAPEENTITLPNVAGKISTTLDTGQEGRSGKVLGASTLEYRYASYLESWRTKIELFGNQYYRSASATTGKKYYGVLSITLKVNANGTLEHFVIKRISGSPELENIAKEFILRASPFDPFPDALRAERQNLEFTRTYTFYNPNNKDQIIRIED